MEQKERVKRTEELIEEDVYMKIKEKLLNYNAKNKERTEKFLSNYNIEQIVYSILRIVQ